MFVNFCICYVIKKIFSNSEIFIIGNNLCHFKNIKTVIYNNSDVYLFVCFYECVLSSEKNIAHNAMRFDRIAPICLVLFTYKPGFKYFIRLSFFFFPFHGDFSHICKRNLVSVFWTTIILPHANFFLLVIFYRIFNVSR